MGSDSDRDAPRRGLTSLEIGLSIAGLVVGVAGTIATAWSYSRSSTVVLSDAQLALLLRQLDKDAALPPQEESKASSPRRSFDRSDFAARRSR